MKKLLVVLVSALMVLTALTGCSGKKEESDDNRTVLTFELSTLSIVPALEATQKVEDVLNDYLLNTLGEKGYKIHLVITSIGDYLTAVPMELASGGDGAPDIVQVFTVANDANNGYILPLDDYLNNELKGAYDLTKEIIGCGKVNGNVYMIPRYFGTALEWKWIYNADMVESEEAKAAGVDPTRVKDIDILGEELAKLKTVYPDERFLVYCNQFDRIYRATTQTSLIGTYGATVGLEDTTVYNYYETEAFKKGIYKAYDYMQKGYADPEGSANTLSHDAVVMAGTSKGVVMGHSSPVEAQIQQFNDTNTYGAKFGAVSIAVEGKETDTLGVGIAHYCKDPAAAARFINLLYTDQFVWDTIIYGAEGQDYEWNEDHTAIRYPEGLDFNSVPYNCQYSCGMIGNGFDYFLPREGGDETGSNGEYGKMLFNQAWTGPLYGFVPSTENVANEVAAVSNVVEQYSDVLLYGDVNPDDKYPEFLQALKDAGIDKILADYQTQADAWIKENKN